MSNKITATCPYCGTTDTHNVGINGNGKARAQCKKCHKGFWLIIKNGKLAGVEK